MLRLYTQREGWYVYTHRERADTSIHTERGLIRLYTHTEGWYVYTHRERADTSIQTQRGLIRLYTQRGLIRLYRHREGWYVYTQREGWYVYTDRERADTSIHTARGLIRLYTQREGWYIKGWPSNTYNCIWISKPHYSTQELIVLLVHQLVHQSCINMISCNARGITLKVTYTVILLRPLLSSPALV